MLTLNEIYATAYQGPFIPRWESLTRHYSPMWFADAKFGIFIHWGPYTVPQYRNEWYARNMYIEGSPEFEHHRRTYGAQSSFGYQDFIPMFTAPAFDPDEWVDLFVRAGARYIMPVSEHHDGFQMYASAISRWNATDMGPRRDVLGELRESAQRAHLHFAASNHRAAHWWFMGHGRECDSDVREPLQRGDLYWPAIAPEPNEFDIHAEPAPSQEFLDDWILRLAELIVRYDPELLYLDWWVQHRAFSRHLRTLIAMYYNRAVSRGTQVGVCYKHDALAWGSGIVNIERGGFATPTSFAWQTETGIARNSWCYTNTLVYKPLSELLTTLITTVSNNGNLLLNVGPRADGSIAERDRSLLEGIGDWLQANGDGIYRTRPWRIAQEGPTEQPQGDGTDQLMVRWTARDWRFTYRGDTVYAFCLAPQGASELLCTTFAGFDGEHEPVFNGDIVSIEQLGGGNVQCRRKPDGLHIMPDYTHIKQRDLPIGFALTLA